MTTIVDLHEEANRRLDALAAAIRASVEEQSTDEHRQPTRVRRLPPAEYDTVAGCDEALAIVRSRVTDLERLPGGDGLVGAARDGALETCRHLATEINAQRSRLAIGA